MLGLSSLIVFTWLLWGYKCVGYSCVWLLSLAGAKSVPKRTKQSEPAEANTQSEPHDNTDTSHDIPYASHDVPEMSHDQSHDEL